MANTQISITENGTTTLATAGKYCDRNIDVNVNIAGSGDGGSELAALQAIEDSMVTQTWTTYYNDRATSVGEYAFSYTKLKSVHLPNVGSIAYGAFLSATSLEEAVFEKAPYIGGAAFNKCSALTKLVLGGSTVCTLASTNAFNNSAVASGTGFIYVPDNLVDSYKAAQYWSTYATQIKPVSELEG